ncbi:MAG: DegT/DnrJ/EryC1/StrS family aminotransferase [Coriobacteriales bacterium]|nr:DegT/DnrJ/EryC1/StrS family aminotransferase [Coriobacteriales bacterium]
MSAESKQHLHSDSNWLESVIADLALWMNESMPSETTSQITGCGAVREAERLFASLHEGRPSLMVPSATAGMLIAMRAIGLGAGCEVIIPAHDWGATLVMVQTLGATAVVVPNRCYVQKDGAGLLSHISAKTRAIVVSHLGEGVDTAAIRAIFPPEVLVIEDCARVFGYRFKGHPAGTAGDLAVFSFGPGKEPIDIGEGGMVVARDWGLWEHLVACGGHPIRQMTAGIAEPHPDALSLRPHPLAAVLLAVRLKQWDVSQRNDSPDLDKRGSGNSIDGTYDIGSLARLSRKRITSDSAGADAVGADTDNAGDYAL